MKTLWSEWDLLLFRNRVLCRKCESDGGDQIIDQVILPESLRQAALEAHHSHTTASHRGVRKTLGALQSRYYWQFTDLSPGAMQTSCSVKTVRGGSSHGTNSD